ncbi:hypothetical protein E4T85_20150 [Bacillus stratosphericus]|nr:hypothetical protein E4T85_20150 [Bacillus stratosphericus]
MAAREMMDREPEPAKRRAGIRQSRRAAAFWGAAAWKHRRVCVSRPLSGRGQKRASHIYAVLARGRIVHPTG